MVIQSVDRAARILLALQSGGRLGVSELAERLGLAKGTVHGLLRSLATHTLVEQDPATGKYMLGPALLQMGNVYLENHDLRVRSLRWADALADRSGLAVRVGVLVWPEVVVVHHVPAADASIALSEVGLSIPAHASCLGKAILAFRDDRDDLVGSGELTRLTSATITDPDELAAQLDRVAETALATERQEAVVGESGVAAAVFGARGGVEGAVSVVVPGIEVADLATGPMADMVREAAQAVSRKLGALAWPPSA